MAADLREMQEKQGLSEKQIDKSRFVFKDAPILPQKCEQIYQHENPKAKSNKDDRGNQNGSDGARVRD